MFIIKILPVIPTSLIILFCAALCADARIGETREECIKRYGEIIEQEKDPEIGEILTFQKDELVVSAIISGGACIGMMYTKERPYTDNELLKKYEGVAANHLTAEQKTKRLAFTVAERFKLLEVNEGGEKWGPLTEETMKTFMPEHLAKAVAQNPEALESTNESIFYRKGNGDGYLVKLVTATDLEGLEGQNAVCEIYVLKSKLFAAIVGDYGILDGF